jgi:tetratricopeptide (TPR) repeat protein
VGRLDALTAVNERALHYYGRDDLAGREDDAQLRRARLFGAIGDDEIQLGRLDTALAAFAAAQRITADQLARRPDDPVRLLEHARNESRVGQIYELRRDWPRAQQHFSRFAAAAERLVARDPVNPDHLMQAGASAVNLGNVQLNGAADFPAARRFYEQAVGWFERAARVRADEPTLRALANAYGWLGDSFFDQGMWAQSLQARQRQHDLVEQLYDSEPLDAERAFRHAVAQRGLGRSLDKVGRRGDARTQLFRAYQGSRRLSAGDPRNAEWLLFGVMVGCDLYYLGLGLPPGVTRERLRREITAAAAELRSQNNPRVEDVANCVRAL